MEDKALLCYTDPKKLMGIKYINKEKIKRILLRGTSWVGDAVMTMPAIEAVRENFPSCEIVILTKPGLAPLYEGHSAVDRVLLYDSSPGIIGKIGSVLNISRSIRGEKFDIAILLQNAFEAALVAGLGRIKIRAGYNTDGRGILLTHGIIRDGHIKQQHQVEYYLNILRKIGLEARTKDPLLHVSDEKRKRAESLLFSERVAPDDFIVGLSPGAIYGPAKRWPAERFASIGDMASEDWGAKILLFGSKEERDICHDVVKSMEHAPVDLSGRTTLGEAIALINRCSLFVTNDSGLMHVAAALNVPQVAIFGSTNSITTGPSSSRAKVINHQVDCSPCLKKKCPENFKCMLDILPGEVWQEMQKLKRDIS